mgnify:CR=1 FL=1
MKKWYILFLSLFMTISSAYAETWVPSGNDKPPIIFVDIDNIYKTTNNNIIYAIRYFKDNNVGDIVSTIYANYDNDTAGIIDSHPYKKHLPYDFKIDNNLKMQTVDSDSIIYNSYIMVKNIAEKKKLKKCPKKFYMYDKYKNIIAFNNTSFSVKMTEEFKNLKSGMTVYFIVNPKTLSNKKIYWKNAVPDGNISQTYFTAIVNKVTYETNYYTSTGNSSKSYYATFNIQDLYINNKKYQVDAEINTYNAEYVRENSFTNNYNITINSDLNITDEIKD